MRAGVLAEAAARRALIPDADLETKRPQRPASGKGGGAGVPSIQYYLTIRLCFTGPGGR